MKNKINFLPTSIEEAKSLGIKEFDVIIVTADAYVDHPSFSAAIIGRYLQSLGLDVGIISQPNWRSTNDFTSLGRPRLFFGVTAGNLDSMVSLYTAQRKIRSDDPYSENGKGRNRPYLPTVVYTNRIKEAYKGVPVIIGGIEASLRRIAHYDYYTDKVRPSILLDSKADILVYGNGEFPLKEIVGNLRSGISLNDMKDIRGTAVIVKGSEKSNLPTQIQWMPSYEEVSKSKTSFSRMTALFFLNLNPYCSTALYQETGSRGVMINPPAFPMNTVDIDAIYALGFKRQAHPMYKGRIPALDMIKFSITAHRGCYGGCSFCSLYVHQGKIVQSRSLESIKKEIAGIASEEGRSVVVTDVGGPTANMYGTYCRDKKTERKCKRKSCLYPSVCSKLNFSADNYLELLKKIRVLKYVKQVYINSGIRADLALVQDGFIEELTRCYTQGQLSVAPEHCEPSVLKVMNKPGIEIYDNFSKIFYSKCKKSKNNYFLSSYFIVGHPGADESTEKILKKYMNKQGIPASQIQEFYPTPSTVATSIYHTGQDPFSGDKVTVEKRPGQKKRWKTL